MLAGRRVFSAARLRGSLDWKSHHPPAGVWVIAALGVWTLWALSAGVLMSLSSDRTEPGDALRSMALVGVGAHLIGILGAVVLVRGLARRVRRSPFVAHPVDALVGVGGLLLAFPVLYVVGAAAHAVASRVAAARGIPAPDTLGHSTLRALTESDPSVWVWVVIADVALLAPVFEEIVYRGFLQTGLVRLLRSPMAGIVLTSAIFALMHAGAVPSYALATLFVLSIGFGIVYERTGRIGAPIAMHAAFNGLNLLIAMQQG